MTGPPGEPAHEGRYVIRSPKFAEQTDANAREDPKPIDAESRIVWRRRCGCDRGSSACRLSRIRRAVMLGLPAIAALLLSPVPATCGGANSTGPQFVGLRVGFADRYKVGHWTAMVFRLRGGDRSVSGFVELTLPDGDGVPCRVTSSTPVRIEAGSETEVTIYAKPGRIDGTLTVAFMSDDEDHRVPLARTSFDAALRADSRHHRMALTATRELVLSVGPSVGVESVAQLLRRNGRLADEAQMEVAALADFGQLPEHVLGYNTVDTVVLSTSRAESVGGLNADASRIAALERFVQLGGRLILCVGEAAADVLASGGPLARFAPGPFQRMVPLRVFSGLESYSGSSIPILHGGGDDPDRRIQAPLIRVHEGRIEAQEDELALVVRRPLGFGQIVFVAVDLDRPPFVDWKARQNLVAKLLGHQITGAAAPQEYGLRADLVSETGFNDLSGQLRAAIDQFPAVRVVPFWLVALLASLYIVLIGPVDYYLVKFLLDYRVLKRVELAWITFVAVVLVVSAGAYGVARWVKGDRLHVNHVHLIDVDSRSGLVRGTSWVDVFSPRTATYDLSVEPGSPGGVLDGGEVVLSWLGLPGAGLGGMNSAVADTSSWEGAYRINNTLDSIVGVPISVWSTKGFECRWWARGRDDSGGLEASFATVAGGFLEGTLRSRLDVPIEDCLLAYDRWAYRLDTLDPDETVRIGTHSQPRTLRTELTGRRLGTDEELPPYDPFALDVPRIMRQIMFHRAAGGTGYTGLLNRYQAELDLSAHLEIGRAMVVGRLRVPVVRVKLDGETVQGPLDRQWTFLRTVFPVKAARAETRP